MISKEKLKEHRKINGLSQDGLSEISGISLRTIQRIEKGDSVGSPFTLKSLAKSLNIENTDLLLEFKSTNSLDNIGILKLINFSSLTVLFIPFSNIIVPLILFLKNKNNNTVNVLGRKILSFQILWTLITLLLMVLIPLLLSFLFEIFRASSIPSYVLVYFVSTTINIFIIIQTAIRINQGKTFLEFTPNIL